jgi:hypothetical protein
LQQVKKHIDVNNERPSATNSETKSLGNWISDQIKSYNNIIDKCKHIMKNQEIHNLWTEMIDNPKYKQYLCIDNVEKWKISLQQLKVYLDVNGKRPNATNSETKSLGKWLQHQITNYKFEIIKCGRILKNQEIYDLWTEMINNTKYKQYFNTSVTTSVEEVEPIVEEKETTPVEEPVVVEEEEEIIIIKKKSMKLPKTKKCKGENDGVKHIQTNKSQISMLHKIYKTLRSDNLHTRFAENPTELHTYHSISKENEKSFPEADIPRNRIITELDKIKTKRTMEVVDMGSGYAEIAEHFKCDHRFTFTNYDHIALNENVVSCDIEKIPLDNDSVEICILSLAMWGSNCENYITEACRILDSHGKLYIIEPTKRWSNKDENDNIIEGQEGAKLKALLEENDFTIVKESISKFCLFICIKK